MADSKPKLTWPYSLPTIKVLHCMSTVSLGNEQEDGQNADLEEVRDRLITRFAMTVDEAERAIETAIAEGALST